MREVNSTRVSLRSRHTMADTKSNSGKKVFQDKQKPTEIRSSNITAAKGNNIIIIFDNKV